MTLKLAYRLIGAVHYRHGGKHVNVQADVVLEEPRVLHLLGSCLCNPGIFFQTFSMDNQGSGGDGSATQRFSELFTVRLSGQYQFQ